MGATIVAGGVTIVGLVDRLRALEHLAIGEQLRALVAASHLVDGHVISISVGVSELRPGQSPQGWIDEADRALYQAKRSGRNRVTGAATEICGV